MPSTPTRASARTPVPSAKAAAASASLAAPVQTPPAKPKSSSTPPGAPHKKQRSAAPKTPDEPPQPPEPAPADAGAASLAAAADQWQLLWKTTHADLEAAKSREADLQQQLKDVTAKFDGLTTERNALQTEKEESAKREQGHLDKITELEAQLERMSACNRKKDEEIKQLKTDLALEQANAEAALATQVPPVDLAKANGAATQAVAGAQQQQSEATSEAPKKRGKAVSDGTANVPIDKPAVVAGELNYAAVPFFRDMKIDNVGDLAKVFFLKKKNEYTDEQWAGLSDTQRYGKKTDATFEAKLCDTLLTCKGQPWAKVVDGKVVPDVESFLHEMYDKYAGHADGTVRKWVYCRLIYPQHDPAKVDADKAWTTTEHAGKSWGGNVGKCVTAGSYLEHWYKKWEAEPDPSKKVWSLERKNKLADEHKAVVKNPENEAKRAEKASAEASAALKKATKSITKQKPGAKSKAIASAAAAAVAAGESSE
jgi:hypothetical protein